MAEQMRRDPVLALEEYRRQVYQLGVKKKIAASNVGYSRQRMRILDQTTPQPDRLAA